MKKETTTGQAPSRVGWGDLEQWVRKQVQHLVQNILEEEVTEFLGRAKSARREPLSEGAGYRNGHGKARSLTLEAGTIQVRRPRVRNAGDRFISRVLPLFQRNSPQIRELIPQLGATGSLRLSDERSQTCGKLQPPHWGPAIGMGAGRNRESRLERGSA